MSSQTGFHWRQILSSKQLKCIVKAPTSKRLNKLESTKQMVFKYFILHIFDDFKSCTQLPALCELWGQNDVHCNPYNSYRLSSLQLKLCPKMNIGKHASLQKIKVSIMPSHRVSLPSFPPNPSNFTTSQFSFSPPRPQN